jgi:hypothetical protein
MREMQLHRHKSAGRQAGNRTLAFLDIVGIEFFDFWRMTQLHDVESPVSGASGIDCRCFQVAVAMTVAAALRHVRRPILATGWRVECPIGIGEFVRRNKENCGRPDARAAY